METADIIRNDNGKKRKKHKKKAVDEENYGGAKTRETLIKEKDDDYVDEQELKVDSCDRITDQVKVSADINPMDSNPRLGDENGVVKKNSSAPKEMPATNNGHRGDSENDHPKEEIDDGEGGDTPTEPTYIGKREAEDIIRNDNRKRHKKHKKKAVVEENDSGAKTMELLIKERKDDYMDGQELKVDSCVGITDQVKVSADINHMGSNPRLGDESGVVKKNASAPKEMPATNNSHRGESENDYPKEEIDDGEGGDTSTEPLPYTGKREAENILRNDNRKKHKKHKKRAVVEENDIGAKTMEMLIKEKEDDYMDDQELKVDSCVRITDQVKVSADIKPIDSNPRLEDEIGVVKKNASAPKEMPATNNGNRDECENDPPKEEIDDGEAGDAPTEPSPYTGKREAKDIIINDNRKKRKKKAVVEENDIGAKTMETRIKDKDDDYMDGRELKVDSCAEITDQVKGSAEINPTDSNPKLGDESSSVTKNASAPNEMPATNNGHRDESENDLPKQEIDDGEAGDAPTEPPNTGKREAEDIIRNDNRKTHRKRKKLKKAGVGENNDGAKTRETLIKEKDGDYMDEQELKVDSCVGITDQVKVYADINPTDSNPRLGDESSSVKKIASAPNETPATYNGHRDENENDHPKEEIDDGEAGDALTNPLYTGKREVDDIIRNDNRKKKKRKKRKKLKKAGVGENDGGAKIRETLIKEKDGDYMDEQELKVKVSADINPMDSNPRLGDESSGVKKNASAPKETPATNNGHRGESENDHPKEEIDDGEPKTKKFEVSLSGTLIPVKSNSKSSKEDGGGKEESSEEEPSKTQEVEESVTFPVENNSSEEISSEEDMAASSDEEENTDVKSTDVSTKATEMDAAPKEQPSCSKTLYVANLSLYAKKADVVNFFKAAGEIVDVHLNMGFDIAFKCFGLVEFTTIDGAVEALNKLNGKVLAGRSVKLRPARKKEVQSFQKGGWCAGRGVTCAGGKFSGKKRGGRTGRGHFNGGGQGDRGRAAPGGS